MVSLNSLSPRELEIRLGNTPERRVLMGLSDGRSVPVAIKDEGGQQGSAKTRMVVAAMTRLRRSGQLTDGAHFVASTSGNTGRALAGACRSLGYSVTLVTDGNAQPDYVRTSQALGARIVTVDEPDQHGNYLAARLACVRKLVDRDGLIELDQYDDPAIPDGYTALGRELFDRAEPDALFLAVSTGGTLAGISAYARLFHPGTRLFGVDVHGSIALPGGYQSQRHLSGIGSSRPSSFLQDDAYDGVVRVSERSAVAACHAFAEAVGLRIGGSCGAVLAAAADAMIADSSITQPMLVFHDSGGYAASIYNPDWLRARDLAPAQVDRGALAAITH